jgi:RNA polymerase sigma factor (sigma-70 family)
MLNELSKNHNFLLEMAKKIDSHNFDDLLQETYLKLHESGKDFKDIDFGYIYRTMRNIYIDSIKQTSCKNREILVDDFSWLELQEEEIKEEIRINKSELNSFENLLLFSLYGVDIHNDKNEIMETYKGVSLLKLSKETGIDYTSLYKTLQRIKEKLCKD